MDDLTPHDRKALELAVSLYTQSEPGGAGEIEWRLAGRRNDSSPEWVIPPESWLEMAERCASRMQSRNLRLKPWEEPPCHIDDELIENGAPPNNENPVHVLAGAVALARRMRDAGISLWHPDPLKALREATSRKKKSKRSDRKCKPEKCWIETERRLT
jgi:hypothetical protein